MTLVDVLLVILIIVFLLSMVDPCFFGFGGARESAKRAACASNLKQIYMGMALYSEDYDGKFPMIDLAKGTIVGEDAVPFNRLPGGEENPFKDIPADAGRSVSQNLWLLMRGDFAQSEIFNCPSSEQAGENFFRKDGSEKNGTDTFRGLSIYRFRRFSL